MTGTFLNKAAYDHSHQNNIALALIYANNWLTENPFHLRFSMYEYPSSIEKSTLSDRNFYASYPPGSTLPVYLLLKTLDFFGVVQDIHKKPSIQLLLMINYNYFLHLLQALVLCFMMFFLCLRVGFDRLNSTLLSLIPAIFQFHNTNSIYYHYLLYNMDQAVLLPYALYVFLETLRYSHNSLRVLRAIQIMQPLVMFYGVLTDWLFVFVILTVYVMRIARKEISLPLSLDYGVHWLKQSFLFFAPTLAAITCWLYQIVYYLNNIKQSKFFSAAITDQDKNILEKLLDRMGVIDSVDNYLYYLKSAFFYYIRNSYGIVCLFLVYATFYFAFRWHKLVKKKDDRISLLSNIYFLFFIPSFAYNLFFVEHAWMHPFSSLKFGFSVSLAFVFLPIFILQITRGNHLIILLTLINKKSIALVTVIGLSSSLLYGYTKTYNKYTVTKMFSQPDYTYTYVGNFVRANTYYNDVVFSKNFIADDVTPMELFFTNKTIYFAFSLDKVYHKTKLIEQDFTIKTLHLAKYKSEAETLASFLDSHNISYNMIQEDNIGKMIAFDGKEFVAWYERIHECNVHPERCMMEEEL